MKCYRSFCFIIAIVTVSIVSGILLTPELSASEPAGRIIDFQKDTIGAEPKTFLSIMGVWLIEKDGARQVYAVDGRKWKQGTLSQQLVDNAKSVFGPEYALFIKNISLYNEFPLSICKDCQSFRNGSLTVSFKAIAGKEDQAAGIAFNIKAEGEYLAVRANALENNLVLFKFEKGKRSSLQWIKNVPPPGKGWHTLKVLIKDRKIEGYLDGKKYIDYTLKTDINGRVGLWSKADSHVLFDNFIAKQK